MAHYYTKDGILVDRILGKNGNPRKTNIKDAREMKLYPSVTELLKIFDKPALTIWKVKEAIRKSLEVPRMDGEEEETYISRVIAASKEKSSTAADFGSLMHFRIDCWLKGLDCPLDNTIAEYWPHVEKYLKTNGFSGRSEVVIINDEIGYAGCADFRGIGYNKKIAADFKTQGTKKNGVSYYNEWVYQLGGYNLLEDVECYSIVISSDEPGRIEEKAWTTDELLRAKLIFKKLCEIFSLAKNLEFSWWQNDLRDLKNEIDKYMYGDQTLLQLSSQE